MRKEKLKLSFLFGIPEVFLLLPDLHLPTASKGQVKEELPSPGF
jgi:hypothetical protein